MFTFSYGVSLGIGLIMGNGFSSDWLLSIYFFCISLIFFFLIIGILGLVPYPSIAPLMKLALFLNPAEFIRVAFVLSLDGGAVFGQAYDSLMTFLGSSSGVLINILYFIGFLTVMLLFSMIMLEWRKRR